MPNSLKARLKKLVYQGILSQEDLDRIIVIPKGATTWKCCKMSLKETMKEIEGIKEFPLTNKEAIKILREELKSNRQNKEYLWQLDDACKMAIVALAMTMTEEEKNTIEKPKMGQGDKYDKWFCPICGNTLWTIWQDFDRPDRCSVCGQLINNESFGGVQDDRTNRA